MNRTDRQRGAAIVEFAVLFLLLVIFVFGIIEFGFIWLQSHYVANAAKEGARAAAVTEDSGDRQEAAERAVRDYLSGLFLYKGQDLNDSNFLDIDYEETTIEVPPEIETAKVVVSVDSSAVWEPILWDLLNLLPAVDLDSLEGFTEQAVFVIEKQE